MQNRYRIFRRGSVFYAHDRQTGRQESLQTKDKNYAQRLLLAKNEADHAPQLNLALGKAYLGAHDPKLISRNWEVVMTELSGHGRPSSQERCRREMRSKPFDLIRKKLLVQTTTDDLLEVLRAGKAATNNYLRRLHNLALGLGWLAWPILAPKMWPKVKPKPKRAITAEEHARIIAAETNPERRLYYGVLWEIGAAQTDAAELTAAQIDWGERTLTYRRKKLDGNQEPAALRIGPRLEALLRQLPSEGPLFPKISQTKDTDRSAEFSRRCRLLGIAGVSLHSFRFSFAERAKTAGLEERFAMAALGHNSRAIHASYGKRAKVVCPSLEAYEQKVIQLNTTESQSACVAG